MPKSKAILDYPHCFAGTFKCTVDTRSDSPAVVMWVLFNEGWGQYDTVRLTEWLGEYEPSRLVNSVSGWNDLGVGNTQDVHSYPGPEAPPLDPDRVAVLGEFGGLGLPLEGLTWQNEENWGYQEHADPAAFLTAYDDLLAGVRDLSVSGRLAAAIYTQTTDVETDVNGLLTYDRAVMKLEPERVRALVKVLYGLSSSE